MAFRSTLNLGGKEYDVLDCNYSLKRDVDSQGRPSSNIYGGRISVRVESTEDTTILETMVNQFKPFNGSIVFKKGDEEGKMKELTFENAYIIEFAEGIDIVGTAPMSISITISAQIIKIGGAEYEENWPKA
ncbi:MAG: type VI secretion system needle protein Hcp [Paludibacteraceae bacterium]|nr:type VI secretion system needle protein Hcp [Paludibacteraceae bacterium]